MLDDYLKLHHGLQAIRRLIGEDRLTCGQAVILRVLSEQGPMKLTQLVDATAIDRSTMSEVVRRLHMAGLLRRRRSKADRRALQVAVSEGGLTALEEFELAAIRAKPAICGEFKRIGITLGANSA